MSDEPKVEVEIEVEPPAPEPEVPVIVPADTGAVADALAMVEHVEEDTDKWVANESAHNALEARIKAVEEQMWQKASHDEVETAAEYAAEAAVEEALEEAEPAEDTSIEVDTEPVPEAEPEGTSGGFFSYARSKRR